MTSPLGDDAIQRETGALVGRLNIPEADDLSAEIAELIRARMASRDKSPIADSAGVESSMVLDGPSTTGSAGNTGAVHRNPDAVVLPPTVTAPTDLLVAEKSAEPGSAE